MNRATRSIAPLLAALTLLGGCADDSGRDPTPTTADPTTLAPATSTTIAPTGPQPIPASGPSRLAAGTAYDSPDFWEPVSIVPVDEGWISYEATDIGIHLKYAGDEARENELDLSVFVADVQLAPEAAAEDLMMSQPVVVVAGPDEAQVAGHMAVRLDVEVTDEGQAVECGAAGFPLGWSYFFGPGVILQRASGDAPTTFGLSACSAARVWFVDVSGSTITIIAGTAGPAVFDAVIPIAERMIAGLSFDRSR